MGSLLVIPDFHGNRSPLSNPTIRGLYKNNKQIESKYIHSIGSIHGIGLETTPKQLYVAAIEGLAFGSRYIFQTIESHVGEKINAIVMTGGLAKSTLFNQVNSNVCGIPVIGNS